MTNATMPPSPPKKVNIIFSEKYCNKSGENNKNELVVSSQVVRIKNKTEGWRTLEGNLARAKRDYGDFYRGPSVSAEMPELMGSYGRLPPIDVVYNKYDAVSSEEGEEGGEVEEGDAEETAEEEENQESLEETVEKGEETEEKREEPSEEEVRRPRKKGARKRDAYAIHGYTQEEPREDVSYWPPNQAQVN
jgi:hypothetical protein